MSKVNNNKNNLIHQLENVNLIFSCFKKNNYQYLPLENILHILSTALQYPFSDRIILLVKHMDIAFTNGIQNLYFHVPVRIPLNPIPPGLFEGGSALGGGGGGGKCPRPIALKLLMIMK